MEYKRRGKKRPAVSALMRLRPMLPRNIAYRRFPPRPFRGNFFPGRSMMPLTRMKTGYNTGFPTEMKMKMKTPFFVTINAGAQPFYTAYMLPNSCYDPWGQIGAEQPHTFDQVGLLYYYYKVSFATISIEARNLAVTNGISVGAYTSYDSTAPTSFTHAMGQPGFKGVTLQASTLTGNGKTLNLKIPIKATLGDRWNDITSMGNSGANPGALVYTHLVAFSDSANLGDGQVSLKGTITQWVTWSVVKPVVDA